MKSSSHTGEFSPYTSSSNIDRNLKDIKFAKMKIMSKNHKFFHFQDLICNFPYCQPYNFHDASSDNLVLDQLIIPQLIIIFLYSHYLPAWYCIDIVRRNSVLVTQESERVNNCALKSEAKLQLKASTQLRPALTFSY